jgi:hypothetical protein
MPYGIAKSLGGDSPENDANVEGQVAALQRRGYDKISAIKIAKANMNKKKSDPRIEALNGLHEMLSGAIGAKLKAKKKAPSVLDSDPEEAQEPGSQLGASGEADESGLLAAKKKAHFGPSHKK